MTAYSMNVNSIRKTIATYLGERWPDVYENRHGAFIVPNFGHTACFIEPSDTKDGRIRINVRAPVLVNVPRSPALFELVAMNATNWAFGALSIYEEDGLNLEFDYAIPADGITSSLLNYLIEAIANTANRLATKLQSEFGGRFLV